MNIDPLDPNLSETHPSLVSWMEGMKRAGYSNAQIESYYFRQQIESYIQKLARNQQPPNQQNSDTLSASASSVTPQQEEQQKIQMAQHICDVYNGRVTLQQIMSMSFERVNSLHQEIMDRSANNQDRLVTLDADVDIDPINIVLALMHQYPQIKLWSQNMKYYDEITTSKNRAHEFVTKLMEHQPQFDRIIESIKRQILIKQRAETNDIQNNVKKDNKNEEQSKTKSLEKSDNNLDECVVCMEGNREYAFIPCGHLCLCVDCKDDMTDTNKCPICQAKYTAIIRIFR